MSAPAKVILFGEHAVVYGEPAISVTLDLRSRVTASLSRDYRVDSHIMNEKQHRYFVAAVQALWDRTMLAEKDRNLLEVKQGINETPLFWTADGRPPPVSFEISSTVPSGSGMGSSAALSVATVGCLSLLGGRWKELEMALGAFATELMAQGRASPNDTATSCLGGAVKLDSMAGRGFRFSMRREDRVWNVHKIEVPPVDLVVGFSGLKSRTADMVALVKTFVDSNPIGKQIISEIGGLTRKATTLIEEGKWQQVGGLMERCHSLLAILGVNTTELQEMVEAVKPHAWGAKLTGAGGGGSVVAVCRDRESAQRGAEAIEDLGYKAFITRICNDGIRQEQI